jgi:hypothetical protein
MNYYIFHDELTPVGVNSLCPPQQMDVVYENVPFYMKNSQLRLKFKQISFTVYSHISTWPKKTWALKIESLHLSGWINTPGR